MDERVGALKERLMDFSLRVLSLFRALPKIEEARVYGRQVLRSSSSVGANHREACRARSKAEFIAKMGDCLKELDETEYWLELIEKAELLPAPRLANIRKETTEITKIFAAILKASKRK